ncbi:hypothetical protein JW756_07120 [Candidatus Woesearchaeota archaeon]|nr:hypothetical protein [Candidatus Woesearchaeota archaeon]
MSMKKASMELSVNFLVVIIISLILLGIGIFLVNKFLILSTKLPSAVSEQQKTMLRQALSEGALVAAYPSILTVSRGSSADFGIGINNELDQRNTFSIYLSDQNCNPAMPIEFGKLYLPGPHDIKNNAYDYIPIRINVPKKATKGTCMFMVYVCKTETCDENPTPEVRYGDVQTLQVNVK